MENKKPLPPANVRAARADDAAAAARLVHLSGPEVYDSMLGGEAPALSVLAEIFARPGHLLSHDNADVAEVNGGVAGLLITYRRRDEVKQGVRYFGAVLRLLPWRRRFRTFLHMIAMKKVVAALRDDGLYGAVISVEASVQGARCRPRAASPARGKSARARSRVHRSGRRVLERKRDPHLSKIRFRVRRKTARRMAAPFARF
ncbi:MAG: hypothetical protein M5R36_23230 [Deltaproteobacteria bacterium]|nr:hypothetical protein [Deltaproteobacteria bacterium]